MGTQFRLLCPICASPVQAGENSGLCNSNGHRFLHSNGIWRFLPLTREVHFHSFMQEYRKVRQAEKWGGSNSKYYRALPRVSRDDPQREVWRIRQKSFASLLSRISNRSQLKIIDAGAGNCWLSNQLTSRGHTLAALDLSDDASDGLGAGANYQTEFECYQAEFDRMPFCPGQFDLVIFNAALHFSSGLGATLREAKRVLGKGGRIIVIDSPYYPDEASGVLMIEAREADFAVRFGIRREVTNIGFLTNARLTRAADEIGLELETDSYEESLEERFRRVWTRARKGREPARFPLIVLGV